MFACMYVCVYVCARHPATGINREMKRERGGDEWKRGNIIKFNLKSVQVLFEFSWRNKILTNPALDHSLPLDSRPRYQQTKLESINVQSGSSGNWTDQGTGEIISMKTRRKLLLKKKAVKETCPREFL